MKKTIMQKTIKQMQEVYKLCFEKITLDEIESVDAFRARSPQTFRDAWIHRHCFEVAYEELSLIPPNSIRFENRQDKYLQAVA